MKNLDESRPEIRLVLINELMSLTSIDTLREFISKGGVSILCTWTKDIKNDVIKIKSPSSFTDTSSSIEIYQKLFSAILSYLDSLPVDWNLLKKTKIGKAVNSVLKAELFDQTT